MRFSILIIVVSYLLNSGNHFFTFATFTIVLLVEYFLKKFPKPKKSKTRTVELLENQKGLRYEIEKDPKSPKYQTAIGFNVEGKIDVKRFGETLKTLREHMQVICYAKDTKLHILSVKDINKVYKPPPFGEPFSKIVKGAPIIDFYMDISPKSKENAIEFIQKNIINNPIDSNLGPGSRFCLIKYDKKKHILVTLCSHLFVDGEFVGIFLKMFSWLYKTPTLFWGALMRILHKFLNLERSQSDVIKYIKKNYKTESTDLEYWSRELKGCKCKFDFGLLPKNKTKAGKRIYFKLDKQLIKKLVTKTKSRDFVALYALYNCWLMKTFNCLDITTFYATTILPKGYWVCGFYITNMLMRIKLNPNSTYLEILNQLSEKRKVERKMKWLPYSKIVERIKRDHNENIILPNVGFGAAVFHVPGVSFGKKTEMIDVQNHGEVPHDFACLYQELDKEFKFCFEFKLQVFDEYLVKNLADSFVHFSKQLLKNPNSSILSVDLLSDKQFLKLEHVCNPKRTGLPFKNFMRMFEDVVKKSPQKIAVQYLDKTLTYEELNSRVNQLSNYIIMKAKLGDFIGVQIKKCIELVVAILAVLKAGCVYVPIDPSLPKNRIDFIIKDTSCKFVLIESIVKNSISLNILFEEVNVELKDLAYVIYTSGSSGIPKGVMVEHGSLVNMALSVYIRYYIEETFAFYLPIAFDAHISEVFPTLISGNTLNIIPEDIRLDPTALLKHFEKYKIKGCAMTPSVLKSFPREKSTNVYLETIVLGGETCDYDTMKYWFSKVKSLVNVYGPTETTVCSHSKLWNPKNKATNIGKPLDEVTQFILNPENLEPVLVGMPGELCIGGPGVARGYLNFKSKSFVDTKIFGRIYRTGDIAYFNEDGDVIFVGRKDYQVKIHGKRVELGEIESVIKRHESVQNIVVLYKNNQLKAFVVPSKKIKEEKQKDEWKKLFDNVKYDTKTKFNTTGWVSSYTGESFSEKEMKEYVDEIVSIILNEKHDDVWEIGCGSGLILFPLAPKCKKSFYATDMSKESINYINSMKEYYKDQYANLTTEIREASNFEGITQKYDVIILNSIVQYFPTESYLRTVIEGCIGHIKSEGGIILIGDVRNLELFELFHFSVQLHKAKPNDTVKQIKERVKLGLRFDKEFLVHPNYFFELKKIFPQISHVQVQPKEGNEINELTSFRFNVILHIKTNKLKLLDPPNWSNATSSNCVTINNYCVGIKNYPNSRVYCLVERWKIFKNLKDEDGVESLLGKYKVPVYPFPLNYKESSFINSKNGSMSFVQSSEDFMYADFGEPEKVEQLIREPPGFFVKDDKTLIKFLKQELPAYMIPSKFEFLEKFPLTKNGKIDRQKLLTPPQKVCYNIPKSENGIRLYKIWRNVLGNDTEFGIHSDFFELGANSLMDRSLIGRIFSKFEVFITHEELHNHSKFDSLLNLIRVKRGIIPPTQTNEISFNQKILYRLSKVSKSIPSLYMMPIALKFYSPINVEKLKECFEELIRVHKSLRLNFYSDGEKVLIKENDGSKFIFEQTRNNSEFLEKDLFDLEKEFDLENDVLIRVKVIMRNDYTILILNIHHIIMDYSSLRVILQDLSDLYTFGKKIKPKPNVYIEWKQPNLKEWDKFLEGYPLSLRDTFLFKKPKTDYSGNNISFHINNKNIKEYCNKNRFSVFEFLFGTFAILVHRYIQLDKFIIGVPLGESFDAIGFFVNTLPLPLDFCKVETFSDLIGQIRQKLKFLFRNQNTNLACLKVKGIEKENPIFQIMFNYVGVMQTRILNQTVNPVYVNMKRSRFHLSVDSIEFDNGQIHFIFEHSIGIDKSMCCHYENLIFEVCAGAPLKELKMLSNDEFSQQIFDFNSRKIKIKGGSILERFEKIVKKYGDCPAVKSNFNGETITYKELDEKSNICLDIKRGEYVGVLFKKDINLVIMLIAIIKNGGVYLPIDPTIPEERIKVMLEDTKCDKIISNIYQKKKRIPTTIDFNTIKDKKCIHFKRNNLDDLLYIIFTSGSTGTPKGIMLTHLNFLNFFEFYSKDFKNLIPGKDSFGMVCSISFDLSVAELLASLLMGLCIKIIPEGVRKDGEGLSNFIEQENVNGLFITPVTLRMLNKRILKKCLKSITIAGDVCDYNTMKKWSGKLKHGYGPAETTIITHEKNDWNSGDLYNNVGRQYPNVNQYILDKHLNPLPLGIPGEIYLGGAQTARGYLNRSNNKKFIKNPFVKGDTIYKTGDWGKYLLNGDLLILGRMDSQIKIRGYRIELGEIENCLRNHKAVNNAIVMAKINQLKVKYLVAYIESKDKELNLRDYLKTKLPDYMIPYNYVFLKKFPQNQNNKVDRHKLSLFKKKKKNQKPQYTNKIQKKLIKILCKVLGLNNISIDVNLFEIGIDSPNFTRLIKMFNKEFKINLPVESIFHYNTIRKLSKLLIKSSVGKNKIKKIDKAEFYSTCSAQDRMIILQYQIGVSAPYNCIFSFKIKSNDSLDKDKLIKSVNKIIERHANLRSNFVFIKHRIYQKVHKKLKIKLKEHNSKKLLSKEVNYNFDLGNEPLIRCSLFANELLVFNFHHVIWDHWSIFVFFRELIHIYNGKKKKLKKLKIQYHDFARWQLEYSYDKELEFWEKELKDTPYYLKLPIDFSQEKKKSFYGKTFIHKVNLMSTKELRKCAALLGTSEYVLTITAFGLLLNKWTKQDDLVFGIPLSNRHYDNVQDLIGFFINSLPIRMEFNKDPRALLDEMNEKFGLISENQNIPIDILLNKLKIKKVLNYNTLFQAMFIFFPGARGNTHKLNLGGVEHDFVFVDSDYTQFEITMFFMPYEDYFELNVTYSTDIFKEETIRKFCEDYEKILYGLCNNNNIEEDISCERKFHLFDKIKTKKEKKKKVIIRKDLINSLKRIYCEVLEIKYVGIDDNFYALGGDSIQLFKVQSKLKMKNIFVSQIILKESPTIRKLLLYIQDCSNYEYLTPTGLFKLNGNQLLPEAKDSFFKLIIDDKIIDIEVINKLYKIYGDLSIKIEGNNQYYPLFDDQGLAPKKERLSFNKTEILLPKISFDLSSIKILTRSIRKILSGKEIINKSANFYTWLDYLSNKQETITYQSIKEYNKVIKTEIIEIENTFNNNLYRISTLEFLLACLCIHKKQNLSIDVQIADRDLVIGMDLSNTIGNIDPIFYFESNCNDFARIEQVLFQTKVWLRLAKQKLIKSKKGDINVLYIKDFKEDIDLVKSYYYNLTIMVLENKEKIKLKFYHDGSFGVNKYLKVIKKIRNFCKRHGKEAKKSNRFLTTIINMYNTPIRDCITRFQEFGKRQPIFFIHPTIGHTAVYLDLSVELNKLCDNNQPFYGINYPDFDKFDTMEDLVKYYIKCIKKVQPKGPYVIGGYSLGAIIALELYRLLGEEINLLITIDAIPKRKLVIKTDKEFRIAILQDVFPNINLYETMVEIVKNRGIFKETFDLFLLEKNKSLPEVRYFLQSRKKLMGLTYKVNLDTKIVNNTNWVCIRTTNKKKLLDKKKFKIYERFIVKNKTKISPYVMKSTHETVLTDKENTTKITAKIIFDEMNTKDRKPTGDILDELKKNLKRK